MRQQKQKLSRQVRDKEEEHEAALQKIDVLRQDIRKAEKLRRELELKADDAVTEVHKEKMVREKLEGHSKQLEKELSAVKAGGVAGKLTRIEILTHQAMASIICYLFDQQGFQK